MSKGWFAGAREHIQGRRGDQRLVPQVAHAIRFQDERRSAWEALDVYSRALTFFGADKLKIPLLIVYAGDNVKQGTTPQSTKLYEMIRGNASTTCRVMLPYEPHKYAAVSRTNS